MESVELEQLKKIIVKLYKKDMIVFSPFFVPMAITNLAAGNIAIDLGAKGMCTCPVTACAGGY